MLCLLLTGIRDAVALAVQILLPVILRKRTNPFQSKTGSEHKAFRFFPSLAPALLSPESRGEPTGKTNNRTPNPPSLKYRINSCLSL